MSGYWLIENLKFPVDIPACLLGKTRKSAITRTRSPGLQRSAKSSSAMTSIFRGRLPGGADSGSSLKFSKFGSKFFNHFPYLNGENLMIFVNTFAKLCFQRIFVFILLRVSIAGEQRLIRSKVGIFLLQRLLCCRTIVQASDNFWANKWALKWRD